MLQNQYKLENAGHNKPWRIDLVLFRMQALEIKVTCISRVSETIQALVIEVRRTYLSGIGEDTTVS